MRPLKQIQIDSLLSELQDEDEYVFLDTARSDSENCNSFLFLRPKYRLDFLQGEDPVEFFSKIENTLADGYYLAGWMSYEFGYLLESVIAKSHRQLQASVGQLLASFGVFREPLHCNHETEKNTFPFHEPVSSLPEFQVENLRASQEKASYLDAVHRIKEYIAAGDTYQVNYTLKLLFDFSGSPEAFYRSLRRNQSVAYGALLHLGDEHILSLSPELFFRLDQDAILVRPMKGTMNRGRDLKEDQALCKKLQEDSKNRSENVMIVDLLRNDLARLTHHFGDAQVVTRSLFDIERYESVLQMTSTICAGSVGRVLDEVSMFDFFRALFPCGSITGAPKIRTMEIIQELEQGSRGVYTGAIGYFSPKGTGCFNVPIRTLRLRNGKGEMGIGSGIVHDSVPEQEWDECLLKAHFLTKPVPDFYLIETILLESGVGFWLLEEHLERLQQSALYFSFVFSKEDITKALQEVLEAEATARETLRLRLTLQKDGSINTSTQVCDVPLVRCLPTTPGIADDSLPRVSLSGKRTDSASRWFFHKTSKRELFQDEFAKAVAGGFFDVLFLNEKQELTEGCISNIIVYLDGKYYTPPVSSGLLAGTMRRRLLAENRVVLQEKDINYEDLQRATALFCCNSVRGLVQVRLALKD